MFSHEEKKEEDMKHGLIIMEQTGASSLKKSTERFLMPRTNSTIPLRNETKNYPDKIQFVLLF